MRRLPDDPVPGSLDERFSDLLDGRLGAADEAELLARLRADPALAREFEQFRHVVESLRRTPQEELPHGLRQRILAATTATEAPVRAAGSRILPIAASLLTAAAAVLLFFLLLPIDRSPAPAHVADGASQDERRGKLAFLQGEVRQDELEAPEGKPGQVEHKAEEQYAFSKQGLAPGSGAPGETLSAKAAGAKAADGKAAGAEAPTKAPGALPPTAKARGVAAPGAELKDGPAPDPQAEGRAVAARELAKKDSEEKPPAQEETMDVEGLLAMTRQQRAGQAGDHRLSVLMISITEPAAEASLQRLLLPLDVAFLPPTRIIDNRIGPVSLDVAIALEAAASPVAASMPARGLEGRLGYAQDHVLLRLRGDRTEVMDLVVGVQGEAARFQPEERTIEGVAARELQATTEWTQLPADRRPTLLDLGEQVGAFAADRDEPKARNPLAPAGDDAPLPRESDLAKQAGRPESRKSEEPADAPLPRRAGNEDVAKEKSDQRDGFTPRAPRSTGPAARGAAGGGPGTGGPATPGPQGVVAPPTPLGGGARSGDTGLGLGRAAPTAVSPAVPLSRPADLIDYYLLIVRRRR